MRNYFFIFVCVLATILASCSELERKIGNSRIYEKHFANFEKVYFELEDDTLYIELVTKKCPQTTDIIKEHMSSIHKYAINEFAANDSIVEIFNIIAEKKVPVYMGIESLENERYEWLISGEDIKRICDKELYDIYSEDDMSFYIFEKNNDPSFFLDKHFMRGPIYIEDNNDDGDEISEDLGCVTCVLIEREGASEETKQPFLFSLSEEDILESLGHDSTEAYPGLHELAKKCVDNGFSLKISYTETEDFTEENLHFTIPDLKSALEK